MKTPEQIWGIPEADATPDEAFELGRAAGYDEAVREAKEGKPVMASLEMAKTLAILSSLVLIVWLGALAEHLGQHPGALIWAALGGFVLALGFGLYAWGAQSATRSAAKGEGVGQ